MVKNQFKAPIESLQTDIDIEYFNSILGNYLSTQGIVCHDSCIDTPQQNRVVESKNQHLLEVARALMVTTHMPKKFWGKVAHTATFLINQMPLPTLNFNTILSTLLTLTLLLVFTIPFL